MNVLVSFVSRNGNRNRDMRNAICSKECLVSFVSRNENRNCLPIIDVL